MPKIVIDKNKGLIQEPGGNLFKINGNVPVNLEGQTTFRRKPVSWAADKTLTKADSGAFIACQQQTTAIDLELPTAAAAGAGWFIDVVLMEASTAAAAIDFQADTAIVSVHCADGGTDSISASGVLESQSMSFTANATVNSSIHVVSDGTRYYARAFTGTTNEIAASDSGV